MTAQTLVTTTPAQVPVRTRRRFLNRGGEDRPSWGPTIVLVLCTLAVIVPLYATVTMTIVTHARLGLASRLCSSAVMPTAWPSWGSELENRKLKT